MLWVVIFLLCFPNIEGKFSVFSYSNEKSCHNKDITSDEIEVNNDCSYYTMFGVFMKGKCKNTNEAEISIYRGLGCDEIITKVEFGRCEYLEIPYGLSGGYIRVSDCEVGSGAISLFVMGGLCAMIGCIGAICFLFLICCPMGILLILIGICVAYC